MEHTENIRKVLAAGLVLVGATLGVAGCATASGAAEPGLNRTLVRESADRYVDQLVDRANVAVTHRTLVRASADHYVDQLVERAQGVVTNRTLVREGADRYVQELIERAHASASAIDDELSTLTGR
jgi:polyhydroxyalkanoate synthesis regulator phasin